MGYQSQVRGLERAEGLEALVTSIDNKAVVLYAVAARDLCDFVDMIRDRTEATDATLGLLRGMLATPGTERTDRGLNELCLHLVDAEIKRRVEEP